MIRLLIGLKKNHLKKKNSSCGCPTNVKQSAVAAGTTRPVLHESCGPLSTCQHALPCMPASKPVSAYVCVLPPGTESREALSREPRPDETRRGRKRGRQLPVGSACAPRNPWPRGNPEARSGLVKRASALASTVHSPGGGVAHEGLGGRCGDGCAQFLASLMGLLRCSLAKFSISGSGSNTGI